MPVAINLTPSAVNSVDYPVVQTPALGGQKKAYLTTKAARVLGQAFATADGVLSYKFVNLPTGDPSTNGPILAVVQSGFYATAAATITYAGLSGTLQPVGWSANQSNFNFPVGRAVELTGTYSAPNASSVPTSAAAKQGSKFALIQVPLLTEFTPVGCTNGSRIKLPTARSKEIACGMESAEWVTKGRTETGELEITGLSHGVDDGLQKFGGLKCTVLLETIQDERVVAMREVLTDWVCALESNAPEGDGEITLSARGMYSKLAILPAP